MKVGNMDDFRYDLNNGAGDEASLENILMEFGDWREDEPSPGWDGAPIFADEEGTADELPPFEGGYEAAPEPEFEGSEYEAFTDFDGFAPDDAYDQGMFTDSAEDYRVSEEPDDDTKLPEGEDILYGGFDDELISAPEFDDDGIDYDALFEKLGALAGESGSAPAAGYDSAAEDEDIKLYGRGGRRADTDAYSYGGADTESADDARGEKTSRVGAMAAEARRYISGLRSTKRREREDAIADDGYAREEAEPAAEEDFAGDGQESAGVKRGAESAAQDDYDFDALLREYGSKAAPEAAEEEAAPEEKAAEDGIEIDSRFNLSGKRESESIVFGNKKVDVTADENYTPVEQKEGEESLYHWIAEDENAEPEDDGGGRRRSKKKEKAKAREEMLRKARQTEEHVAEGFDDEEAEPAEYADRLDEESRERYGGDSKDELYFPPTFREYLSSLFASLFLRVRGTVKTPSNYTMEDTDEELGAELSPAAASKYYGSFVRSQRLRLRISAGVLLLLCYLTIGLPVPGMLKYLPTAAAACCAMQFTIMLLSLDVVTNAVMNVFRLKIGADSLAVFACLLTAADALMVALVDSAALHMPLCALSSLALFGAALSSSLSARGLRKATRVPAIGKRFYAVTGEIKFKDKQLTLLKSLRSATGFVRRAEEAPPDETLFIKLSPVILLMSLFLTIILAIVTKSFSDFLYIFSAVLAPSVPFTALIAFALPYFLGSNRIFKSGAAIAGWSGLCDIGASKNLIVTDRDLFPDSSISMESVRIFANEKPEKVIAYAGTLICASGSCLSGCFARLMEKNNCAMQKAEDFEYLAGGGMRALIDGHTVLCGSTDLMRLMNVRIPFRLTSKTSVLLAIDGTLYGIFAMKYTPLPQVRKSLVELVRSSRHPVFAIRDFNITPEMLHNTFDLATDGYDFPPYVERFSISEPSRVRSGTGKIAAVLCNEGLGPLTDVADVGRSIYVATKINVVISALAAVFCALFVFIKLLTAGCVTAGFLLTLMLLWALPVFLVSLYVLKP